jgi:thiol:disulfide interchange protein DsbA
MVIILGSYMTKSSIVLFAALLFSLMLSGCSEAPPPPSSSADTVAEADAYVQQPAAVSPLVPSKWIEGTHYNVIADSVSEQKQVVEYFSFWCPACYGFEAVANQIKSKLAEDVTFRKVHVNFMGFTTPDIQEQATKAMLIGRKMGMEELTNAAIFGHIHEQKQQIDGMSDLRELFISYDISGTDFDSALATDELTAAFDQNNSEITQFKEHLNSVPNIVVNGKYQAKFTREMTLLDVVELVNWLSQQQ